VHVGINLWDQNALSRTSLRSYSAFAARPLISGLRLPGLPIIFNQISKSQTDSYNLHSGVSVPSLPSPGTDRHIIASRARCPPQLPSDILSYGVFSESLPRFLSLIVSAHHGRRPIGGSRFSDSHGARFSSRCKPARCRW
jgi:hypothetical protein